MVPEGFDTSNPMNRHVTTDERSICFAEMTPEEFCIDDVPHALSKICRYNGLINRFYSVAQHSVLVCELAEATYGKGRISEAALMHDAVEAYLGDISRPFKALLPDYMRIEQHVENAIKTACDLPPDPAVWKEVKRFDVMALFIEANHVLLYDYSWIKPKDPLWKKSQQAHKLAEGFEMLPDEAHRLMVNKLRDYGYDLKDVASPGQRRRKPVISHDPRHTNPGLM